MMSNETRYCICTGPNHSPACPATTPMTTPATPPVSLPDALREKLDALIPQYEEGTAGHTLRAAFVAALASYLAAHETAERYEAALRKIALREWRYCRGLMTTKGDVCDDIQLVAEDALAASRAVPPAPPEARR